MRIPDTITWTTYHEDGQITNNIYMAPKDPEAIAMTRQLLGPLIMEGTVSAQELQDRSSAMPKGVFIPHNTDKIDWED